MPAQTSVMTRNAELIRAHRDLELAQDRFRREVALYGLARVERTTSRRLSAAELRVSFLATR